jgi:hypothetical protein
MPLDRDAIMLLVKDKNNNIEGLE